MSIYIYNIYQCSNLSVDMKVPVSSFSSHRDSCFHALTIDVIFLFHVTINYINSNFLKHTVKTR